MRGNLAPCADIAVSLNFNERADTASVADRAPIEIDEIGVRYDDVGALVHVLDRHVRRYLSGKARPRLQLSEEATVDLGLHVLGQPVTSARSKR